MGLRIQQWRQIARSLKPIYRIRTSWRAWWESEYPYQWMSETTNPTSSAIGGTPADLDSLEYGLQQATPPEAGKSGTESHASVERTDTSKSRVGFQDGVGADSLSQVASATSRISDQLRPLARSVPDLLPTGSLTMMESLRHWTVQWTLHSQSPVAVERALAHHEMLLNPLPEETLFLSVLNQMIEEQPKQSDSLDEAWDDGYAEGKADENARAFFSTDDDLGADHA